MGELASGEFPEKLKQFCWDVGHASSLDAGPVEIQLQFGCDEHSAGGPPFSFRCDHVDCECPVLALFARGRVARIQRLLCKSFSVRVPHPCVLCKGGRRCCRRSSCSSAQSRLRMRSWYPPFAKLRKAGSLGISPRATGTTGHAQRYYRPLGIDQPRLTICAAPTTHAYPRHRYYR
jgi:hypothetical protein